jgi:hypothetical protein
VFERFDRAWPKQRSPAAQAQNETSIQSLRRNYMPKTHPWIITPFMTLVIAGVRVATSRRDRHPA